MSRLVYCDQKMIDLDACEVVYNTPFTLESLKEDFEAPSGHWSVKDGCGFTEVKTAVFQYS